MPSTTHKPNTLMLIDDNEIDLMINSKIIGISKLFDHTIKFQSGEAAISYLRKHIHQEEDLPNFILLDIQMPDMNGFEVLELYRKLPKKFTEKCTVAMLSSTLDFGDIKKAEANPYVIKLLKKPLNIKELEALIKI